MRELGRALALDPTYPGALAALERLLTDVPTELPPEGVAEMEEHVKARRRAVLRSTVLRTFAWIAMIPVVLAFGVTHWGLGTVLLSSVILTFLFAVGLWRTGRTSERALLALYVLSAVALGALSLIFGSLVFLPALVVTNSMFFALDASRTTRRWIVGLALLVIVLPYAAQLAGALPMPYEFTSAGTFVIRSPMVRFDAVLTPLFLLVTSVSLVLSQTVLIGRFKDELERAERRVIANACHLRQLLPRDTAAP
jgi:hypothetical protein